MGEAERSSVTPESIISIPVFEGPWPNASGSHLLYIERTFSPDTHKTTVKLCLQHIQTNEIHLLRTGSQIRSCFWIEGSDGIVVLEQAEDGHTDVSIRLNATDIRKDDFVLSGTLPAEVEVLGVVQASSKIAILAFSAPVQTSGGFEAQSPKSWSTGREYSNVGAKNDFSGIANHRTTIFCAIVELSDHPMITNNYFDTLLGTDKDYESDIGIHLNRHGVVVIAKARSAKVTEPHLTTPYYVPMPSIIIHDYSTRQELSGSGLRGFSSQPRISEAGDILGFLQKRNGWLDDDTNILVTCEGLQQYPKFRIHEIYCNDGSGMQLSPKQILMRDKAQIFFIADDRGESKLFKTILSSEQENLVAEPLTQDWSVDSFHLLPGSPKILLAGSTMTSPRRWLLLNPEDQTRQIIAEGTSASDKLKLEEIRFDSIDWVGADGMSVQAWLVKPRDFDPSKRYPLLYYIHGGPNIAVNNEWAAGYHCNWNLPLFAEQGFVVIAPNATGSTGFGQDFANRVANAWGDKGYTDHVNGFQHIKNHLPFIDTTRAVALGMSYGGFMINWIQGHALGREFKALVAECAFINTATRYTFDLISSVEDHYGGPAFNVRRHDKYNPINHIQHWSTPTLFIANEQDLVPIIESRAAVHVLYTKGIQTRLLSFSDEGHVVFKPDNRLHWWRTVFDWCIEHTRA